MKVAGGSAGDDPDCHACGVLPASNFHKRTAGLDLQLPKTPKAQVSCNSIDPCLLKLVYYQYILIYNMINSII